MYVSEPKSKQFGFLSSDASVAASCQRLKTKFLTVVLISKKSKDTFLRLGFLVAKLLYNLLFWSVSPSVMLLVKCDFLSCYSR